MGCKPIICSVCHGTYAACQMVNGVCATCRAKEKKDTEKEAK